MDTQLVNMVSIGFHILIIALLLHRFFVKETRMPIIENIQYKAEIKGNKFWVYFFIFGLLFNIISISNIPLKLLMIALVVIILIDQISFVDKLNAVVCDKENVFIIKRNSIVANWTFNELKKLIIYKGVLEFYTDKLESEIEFKDKSADWAPLKRILEENKVKVFEK